MVSKYSDEALLLKALKADKPKAFRYLYDEYKYWMMLEAYGYLNDQFAAQDIVQDLLIDFWQHKLYENVAINLKGYLIVMIRNRALNYLRKLSRQKERFKHYITVEELVLPDVNLERTQLSRQIDEAIDRLSPRTKSAFIHCYIEQLSHQQAANLMGVSRNTLRALLNTALKKLRKQLKNIVSD